MSQSLPVRRSRRLAATLVTALAVSAAVLVAAPARSATRDDVLTSAASYARQQGFHVGIAVYDTRTGMLRGAGDYAGTFASESLIKVFIATRLLLSGRMHGTTASRAYKMITRSDDAIASSLYGSVGGDGLVRWIAWRYHVNHLGYAPSRAGWWGNTHLHPDGLVRLYAQLKADPKVGPWLLDAMRHATRYGSDGVYQYFGIPSATTRAAIKQGWGNDYEIGSNADFNSTGFVNGDRYAIAILARGPSNTYGSRIGNLLTSVARRLLPAGHFPDGIPTITGLSTHSGSTLGGNRVTIWGHDFTGIRSVRFGRNYYATAVRVMSPSQITVTAPQHIRIDSYVRVQTTHGITPVVAAAHYLFESPPAVDTLSSAIGKSAGGNTITVGGTAFTRITQVLFGSLPATFRWISRGELGVTVPKHAAGVVEVTVITRYGRSPHVEADHYRFVDPPTIKSVTQNGSSVTITGSGYFGRTTVRFGTADPVVADASHDSTTLTVTPPSDAQRPIVVTTPYGSSNSYSAP
ncbi:MAG: IPT/TIG domain-containing protein [Jatrophihabitantaceae bacterium]